MKDKIERIFINTEDDEWSVFCSDEDKEVTTCQVLVSSDQEEKILAAAKIAADNNVKVYLSIGDAQIKIDGQICNEYFAFAIVSCSNICYQLQSKIDARDTIELN